MVISSPVTSLQDYILIQTFCHAPFCRYIASGMMGTSSQRHTEGMIGLPDGISYTEVKRGLTRPSEAVVRICDTRTPGSGSSLCLYIVHEGS